MTPDNPHVQAIKEKAHEISVEFEHRHDPDNVNNFVQMSLGAASLCRLFGEEADLLNIIRTSAELTDPDEAESLQRDEELCYKVIIANQEMAARGNGDF
jgi:hypothetical protein